MRPLVLIALALLSSPPPARSERPDEGGAPVEWIRPEEVAARADALVRRFESAGPDAAAEERLRRIERGLAQVVAPIDEALARAAAVSGSELPPEIEEIRLELTSAAAPLEGWKTELAAEAKRVAETLDAIDGAERVWSATLARPETAAAGEVVVRRVEASLAVLTAVEARLRDWRTHVLAASDEVLDRSTAIEAALEKVRTDTARRASLLVPDRPPLWARGLGAEIRRELPRVPAAVLAYGTSTVEYVREDPRPLILQAFLGVLLMAAFRGIATRGRRRLAGETPPSRAMRLFERPYAVGLLLSLLTTPVLHPLAPRRLTQLVATIALLPTARIVIHVSEHAHPTAFVGLFAVLLLDRIALAVAALPAIARAIFVVILVLALGLSLWFLRRLGPAVDAVWLRLAARLAVAGLALGVLAEICGWTYLASLLGRGIIGGAIAGLFIYAAVIAVEAALAWVLASGTLRRSRVLARETERRGRRMERTLRWLGAGAWLYLVVSALGLRGPAGEAFGAFMGLGVSVGALTVTIGDVVAFVLTLLTAFLVTRVVTGVLEEDVYPRTRLPRGVPYVLSTLTRYVLYSVGVVFALAAAGVELGQVGFLIGGLGIGIGLGLQDLVKNFAAGLTLLLERRVHVGDAIQTPNQEVFGRVLAIGTRATVVRNWNGAEVVVPNADLVSGTVTNWTLSDRLCRIEVPVGVAYGTDPERVLGLLLDAARSVEGLLGDPAPQALFRGFGDSSLDFVVRAWTDGGYDQMLPLTSGLALTIHRVFRDAGITIPFPQREVHVTSVAPAVRAALPDPPRTE